LVGDLAFDTKHQAEFIKFIEKNELVNKVNSIQAVMIDSKNFRLRAELSYNIDVKFEVNNRD